MSSRLTTSQGAPDGFTDWADTFIKRVTDPRHVLREFRPLREMKLHHFAFLAWIAGVVLWGLLFYATTIGTEEAIQDSSRVSTSPTPTPEPYRTDCNLIRATVIRNDAERLWFEANCSAAPTPTATPLIGPGNRTCQAIRGTAYLSEDERRWFLSNCVAR